MVSPAKIPSFSLPLLVSRKIFGKGHAGLYVSSRSTARGDKMSIPCAPSPPRAFCQEDVAITGNPVTVRHAHAGGRAVPGEDDVGCKIDFAEIGQIAVRRPDDSDV